MTRKFLEEMGLTKEQVDKILDENSQDIGKAKGDLDNAQTEVATLKGQIKDRDKQLETLKKSTGDVESLKKQIETLQEDNKTAAEKHALEVKSLKVESLVSLALTNAKAKNNVAVKALLKDLDKAEISEDGTVKGLSEQIEALKKADETKFLFESGATKLKGAKLGESSIDNPDEIQNPWSDEHFNLTRQGEIIKKDPELAKQLMKRK